MFYSSSPSVLNTILNAKETQKNQKLSKFESNRGTIFKFSEDVFWQLQDVVILPCLICKEKLKIYGLETEPSKNGLFKLDNVLFKNFKVIENWIIYE